MSVLDPRYDAEIVDGATRIGLIYDDTERVPDKLMPRQAARQDSGDADETRSEFGTPFSQSDFRGGSGQEKHHGPGADPSAYLSSNEVDISKEARIALLNPTVRTLDWSAGGSPSIEAALEEVNGLTFAAWGGHNAESNIVFRHDGEFPGAWTEEDASNGEAGGVIAGPTRFYPQNEVAPATPAFDANWDANSGLRRSLAKSKSGALAEVTLPQSGAARGGMLQLVSNALVTGTEFKASDQISAVFDVRESGTGPGGLSGVDGPNSPGTLADDSAVGAVAWTDPANAAASDGSYATAAFPIEATAPTSGGTFASDNSIGETPWTDPSNAAASDDAHAIATSIDIPESSGPQSPTAALGNVDIGQIPWSNPTNVFVSDNSYANVVLLVGQETKGLTATGFDFSVPSDATITGIIVEIERKRDGAVIQDWSVRLRRGGANAPGDNKATGATWPTVDAYAIYGSSSDLWGTTWTPAQVNASDFGVKVHAQASGSASAYIDHIRITVHYTVPSTTTEYLKATNFGFAIPANAIIKGITAEVERFALGDTAAALLGVAVDNSVRLVKGGVVGGSDKASSSAWPAQDVDEAYASYGSSTDLWGRSWTAADINAADFGFVISATAGNPEVPGAVPSVSTVNIDHIHLTVHYVESDTHYLKATNFGFAIPLGAMIDGVKVEIEKRANAPATIRDGSVRIIKGGSYVGTDKADTYWFIGDTYKTYGGPSDLWGTTWTPAEINAADFGAAISAAYAGPTAVDAFVDHIRITIYYSTSTKLCLIARVFDSSHAEQAVLFDSTAAGSDTDWGDSDVAHGGSTRLQGSANLAANYMTVAGDYLVIEVGFRTTNDETAGLSYGGDGADLPLATGDMAAGHGWVELSNGIQLIGEGIPIKVYDLAAVGEELFAACGFNGIHKRDSAGIWAHYNDAEAVIIRYLKSRIIAASESEVWEITASGATPIALDAALPAGWRHTDVTEEGPFIYVSAVNEQAGLSRIFHYGLSPDGAVLEPKGSSRLPRNQLAYALGGTGGGLWVGCGRKTIGTESDPNARDPMLYLGIPTAAGELTFVKMAEDDDQATTSREVRAIEPVEEGVLVAWTPDEFQGVGLLDSSLPSFAHHLSLPDDVAAGQARITDIIRSVKGRIMLAVPSQGVYYQDRSMLATDGEIVTSGGDHNSKSKKLWFQVEIEHDELLAGESIQVYYSTVHPDEGEWTLAGTSDVDGATYARFEVDVAAVTLWLRFVLNRGTDVTHGPIFHGFTAWSYPYSGTPEWILQRDIRIKAEDRSSIGTAAVTCDPIEKWEQITTRALEIMVLEERDATWRVRVEDMQLEKNQGDVNERPVYMLRTTFIGTREEA